MKRILFTGGGSAGHVVPNLAIMHELRYTHELFYMGTDGIEKGLVTRAGFPFLEVNCPRLVRKLTFSNLKIPFALHAAKKRALELIQETRPDLVFSKGGYVSYPAVWAAHKLSIPVLTHESDLTPGLCTKLIKTKCKFVLTSFPETAEKFQNGICTGSPIRREVLCGERSRARHKYGFSEEKPVLLVLGGGSGSRALNEAIEKNLPALLVRFQILHLCGMGASPKSGGHGYLPRAFEADMGSAYAAADLVLCRAGSNTVFEVLTLKKPALLVPLSKSGRGDQVENALYFQRRGLVHVLPETELFKLNEELSSLLSDEALRAALSASDIRNGTPAVLEEVRKCLL